MALERRSFLSSLATAGAGTLLSGCASHPPPSPFHSAWDRVELGRTGIVTSRLGFGTGIHSWMRDSELKRRRGPAGAVKLIRAAYERGIRFFDLADSYGTHAFAAEALAPFPRDSYVLSTKVWFADGGIPAADKADAETCVRRFLKELRTDYLDVVQLHCVTSAKWPVELADACAALERLKKTGAVRAHGCSFHSYSALEAACACDWLDCAHVRINPYGRVMSSHPARVMKRIGDLHAQGKGVIGMKILACGGFAKEPEKIDRSIAYALDSGAVDVLNVGFLSLAEIDDLASRIARVPRKAAVAGPGRA